MATGCPGSAAKHVVAVEIPTHLLRGCRALVQHSLCLELGVQVGPLLALLSHLPQTNKRQLGELGRTQAAMYGNESCCSGTGLGV